MAQSNIYIYIPFHIILCVLSLVSGTQDTVVGIEAKLRVGQSGARIPAKARGFSLAPNRPYRLWGPPSLLLNGHPGSFQGLKRLGSDVNPSPPSSAEVKTGWSYTSTAPTGLRGVERSNFTLIFFVSLSAFAFLSFDSQLVED
jgi:hypothetical protein